MVPDGTDFVMFSKNMLWWIIVKENRSINELNRLFAESNWMTWNQVMFVELSGKLENKLNLTLGFEGKLQIAWW